MKKGVDDGKEDEDEDEDEVVGAKKLVSSVQTSPLKVKKFQSGAATRARNAAEFLKERAEEDESERVIIPPLLKLSNFTSSITSTSRLDVCSGSETRTTSTTSTNRTTCSTHLNSIESRKISSIAHYLYERMSSC